MYIEPESVSQAMSKKTAIIKILDQIPGYPVNTVLTQQCDEEGTPLDYYWQRRLKDAKTDGCCEVVAPKKAVARDTDAEKAPKKEKKS